ncbi:hypothetical protein [Ferrovibrio xuzhouensis]|uniref:Uncharacterized protein n=1 Tax=Ferrovibrio xuzhouensis TaxID=1576914 RepID=A0ABV7VD77_9PROT
MDTAAVEQILTETSRLLKSQGASAALTYCETQFRQNGGDARLLQPMAQLYGAVGNFETAISILDNLVRANPAVAAFQLQLHETRQRQHLAQHHGGAADYPTVSALETDIEAALARGDFDYALWAISRLSHKLVKANGMGAPDPSNDTQLDQLCLRIGSAFAAARGHAPMAGDPAGPVVYLATALHEYGGHSRVVIDYIRRQPDRRHVIMLTGMNIRLQPELLRPMLDTYLSGIDYGLLPAPPGRFDGVMRWLFEQLSALRPSAVFLFQHPHDAIALTPIPLLQQSEIYFNHHVDTSFCLGATLKLTGHIDQTPVVYNTLCRDTPGLDPVFVPMTVPDPGVRDPATFGTRGPLRTGVCGSYNKFMDQDYAFRYAEVLPVLLGHTGGEHVHIGTLPDDYLATITANLQRQGIAPERFRYVPHVVNLARALDEFAIDLYLTSFPVGGGKAAIEAMASGTPVLCHQNYKSRTAGAVIDMVYPEAPAWHDLDSLAAALQAATPAVLQQQSRLSRAYFEAHHAVAVVEGAWRDGRPVGLPVAPLRPYRLNAVQRMLDRFSQPGRT